MIEPDGKARVQWGTAENADTGTSGAAPGAGPSTGTAGAGAAFRHFPSSYQEFRQQVMESRQQGKQLPEFTAGKQGYLVCLTNEQVEDATVWPMYLTSPLSPEEQAARRAQQLAEAKARIAGITARLALAHPALHPIIELHHPEHTSMGLYCSGCDAGAYAEDSAEWPCSTIELILEGL